LLEDVHAPEQLFWHVALQSVLQSKLPGLAEHLAEHPPSQLASQLGSVAVHMALWQLASSCASHASCKFGGWHWTSHPALASAVHVSLPLKTAPPQSE
jgi:hypothetical protein